MTTEELMNLSENELIEMINKTRLETEKLKLQNLKKIVTINQLTNNN